MNTLYFPKNASRMYSIYSHLRVSGLTRICTCTPTLYVSIVTPAPRARTIVRAPFAWCRCILGDITCRLYKNRSCFWFSFVFFLSRILSWPQRLRVRMTFRLATKGSIGCRRSVVGNRSVVAQKKQRFFERELDSRIGRFFFVVR